MREGRLGNRGLRHCVELIRSLSDGRIEQKTTGFALNIRIWVLKKDRRIACPCCRSPHICTLFARTIRILDSIHRILDVCFTHRTRPLLPQMCCGL